MSNGAWRRSTEIVSAAARANHALSVCLMVNVVYIFWTNTHSKTLGFRDEAHKFCALSIWSCDRKMYLVCNRQICGCYRSRVNLFKTPMHYIKLFSHEDKTSILKLSSMFQTLFDNREEVLQIYFVHSLFLLFKLVANSTLDN